MASENTIRTKAKEYFTEDGWIISIPKRQRYGSTTTTLPVGDTFDNDKQYKGHDDFFSLFDGIAWKGNKIVLAQWTSHLNVSNRVKKITDFLEEHKTEIPDGVTIKVMGYTNGEGFTRVEKI